MSPRLAVLSVLQLNSPRGLGVGGGGGGYYSTINKSMAKMKLEPFTSSPIHCPFISLHGDTQPHSAFGSRR